MTSTKTSDFCVYCGETLADGAAMWHCSTCGLRSCAGCVGDGSDTCPDCHTPFSRGDNASTQPDAPESSASQPSPFGNQKNPPPEEQKQPYTAAPSPVNPNEHARVPFAGTSVEVYSVDQDAWRASGRIHASSFGPIIIFWATLLTFALAVALVALAIYVPSTYAGFRRMSSASTYQSGTSIPTVSPAVPPPALGRSSMLTIPHLLGDWEGQFASYSGVTTLHVAEQSKSGSLYGTLVQQDKVIAIDGSATAQGKISWTETKLLRGSGWLIGKDKGHLNVDGTLSGEGNDGHSSYTWTLRRLLPGGYRNL